MVKVSLISLICLGLGVFVEVHIFLQECTTISNPGMTSPNYGMYFGMGNT